MGTYWYWQHFLALEADFAATSRYVEFSKDNFGTYSVEYAKLLLAIGSEVDVLCKIMCRKYGAAHRNIDDYRECLTAKTKIASEVVVVRRYNLTFRPWGEWSDGSENPAWWKSYNNVKHHRDSHFADANLETSANAISGLFIAVLYCREVEGMEVESLRPMPVLLGRDQEPGAVLLENDYYVPEITKP